MFRTDDVSAAPIFSHRNKMTDGHPPSGEIGAVW